MIPTIQDQPILTDQSTQIPPVQSKGSNLLLLILFIVVAAVAGFIGYELGARTQKGDIEISPVNPPIEEGVACTMEAQICPDGSSVGRMPPDCEFAACPSGETSLHEADGYSFEYPENWTLIYKDPQNYRVTFSNNNSPSATLIVEKFEYQDFVNRLFKKPKTDTLKDQIAEFVAYQSNSTANVGDMCPEVDEWIPINKADIEGYIVPITLKCRYESAPASVVWSFIKNGNTLLWLNEDEVGQVPITESVIDTLVFK